LQNQATANSTLIVE